LRAAFALAGARLSGAVFFAIAFFDAGALVGDLRFPTAGFLGAVLGVGLTDFFAMVSASILLAVA
jgi:hypothetical protein